MLIIVPAKCSVEMLVQVLVQVLADNIATNEPKKPAREASSREAFKPLLRASSQEKPLLEAIIGVSHF